MKPEETIEILGDTFVLERHPYSPKFVINHSKWCLGGVGDNFIQAVKDLLATYRVCIKEYCKVPIDSLTPDAVEFRMWLCDVERNR